MVLSPPLLSPPYVLLTPLSFFCLVKLLDGKMIVRLVIGFIISNSGGAVVSGSNGAYEGASVDRKISKCIVFG